MCHLHNERGLSLPDISLLGSLAKILKVDIADILDGKMGANRRINIEDDIEKVTKELTCFYKKKGKKCVFNGYVYIRRFFW